MIAFAELGLVVNLAVFAAAAAVVWMAGVRITRYANVISVRTGIGQALVGMLLLGGVTSLPEVAVAVSAAAHGEGSLAVNSVLGGIAMQVAILAVADIAIGKGALTAVVPNPIVFLQGAFKVFLLSIAASAIVVGDVAVLGIGLWMWLLFFLCIFAMWALARAKGRRPWRVADDEDILGGQTRRAEEEAKRAESKDLRSTIVRATGAAAAIVVAGYVLSRTGDAIAEQSGLGESFIGAVLVAIATSLPEVSTVLTAARAGLYTLAVSDIFGTNLFDVTLLFVIDAVAGGEPVLNGAGRFSTFAALIAITVTMIFVAGVAERRDRTVLRMGIDSLGLLVTYAGGLVVLYFLR
ncbi:MAG: sodium:calcium antiporter [Pseudomonadota bacterium]